MVQNRPWPDVSLKHRGCQWDTAVGPRHAQCDPSRVCTPTLLPSTAHTGQPLRAQVPREPTLPGRRTQTCGHLLSTSRFWEMLLDVWPSNERDAGP